MCGFDPAVGTMLLEEPKKTLQLLDEGLAEAQNKVLQVDSRIQENARSCRKPWARVRVYGIHFQDVERISPTIGSIRSIHCGRFLSVAGTVIRTGLVKMLESQQLFECTKCKHKFSADVSLELGKISLPAKCPSDRANPCKGVNFKGIEGTQIHRDYQEIKIQERNQGLSVSAVPRSIVVILEDDLVDTCKAGDDVVVTGTVMRQWRRMFPGARCDLELSLLANSLQVKNEHKSKVEVESETVQIFQDFWRKQCEAKCPLAGRNTILASICPQVYGLFSVKLAVALMLIGGVPRTASNGTHIRGEVHLLLVGDPGTGKSQFLKYAAKLSPRSVLTTGMGSTAAGLTVTAQRDGGEWVLEAGALVLGDGGLCCIDEFDGIREADRATIHEAMEQQTLSVAKAGLVTTLNTRTTVFGVTNPKGNYDPSEPLSVNTSLSGPLLSRFDIVLVLLDTKNPQWDNVVSDHILSSHQGLPAGKRQQQNNADQASPNWTMELLQKYICHVKASIFPVMTEEAERIIMGYYQLSRREECRSAARTTIRLLESLIRLAEAHARLMYRHEVLRVDAVTACVLVEASMNTNSFLGDLNALHSTFHASPDADYLQQEHRILRQIEIGLGGEFSLNTQAPTLGGIRVAEVGR